MISHSSSRTSATILLLSATLTATPAPAQPKLRPDNIQEVVAAMTPEEKVGLVVGGKAKNFNGIGDTDMGVPGAAGYVNAIPRLGIPRIILADGPAGLRINPVREGDPRTFYCTGFPVGTMLAASWNPDIVEAAGAAIGNEVLEYGVDVLLAPGANIQRNPLCGRNFEYYSEDPLLTGKIAAAYIRGVQSAGVGTSLKHFACNNQEINRLANDARLSERALREIYLRNFETAVREARPWTLMTSYNFINGVHASESRVLLTDILREEWGFDGAVMTDWGGGYIPWEQVAAGNDMIQPGKDIIYEDLIGAVRSGRLGTAALDTACARILRLVVKCPAFRGYACSEQPDLVGHALVCKETAEEGIVLLKNRKNALPLKAGSHIALYGTTSYDFIAGGTGSGDVHRPYVVDLRMGLDREGFVPDAELTAWYERYMDEEKLRRARIDKSRPKWYIDAERALDAIPRTEGQIAARTDAAIVTFGRVFGEGKDRDFYYNYQLLDRERELLEHISATFHAAGKPVIVILNTGGAMETASWQDLADAILVCWQPGQEGGHSVAAALSGEVNPSGRLPMSWSKDYAREPSAPDFPKGILADKPVNYSYFRETVPVRYVPADSALAWYASRHFDLPGLDWTDYSEDIYVGYRYWNTFDPSGVAWPFGFGLSYTRFSYGKMSVEEKEDGDLQVRIRVSNSGPVAGKEVVQVYAKAPGAGRGWFGPKGRKGLKNALERRAAGRTDLPERELRGFAKTPLLAPGESCELLITISRQSLASWSEGGWSVPKGRWTFIAARHAADRSRTARIRID